MDDAGKIEPADCDCLYCQAGFSRKISDIHSVGKLTGHGMSLVGTEIVQLLEAALPKRFGGAPADYQLVELEGRDQTQIELRISPRVKIVSTQEVRDFFLREVRHCYAGRLAASVWGNGDVLQVIQAEPVPTSSGKVLPLEILSSSGHSSYAG
jgi:hypothetical protein